MEGAGELVQLHRHPRSQQCERVRDPLVTQGVVLGGRDVRRRQTAQIRRPAGRSVGRDVGRAGELAEVGLPAPHRQRPVPQRRVDELLHGRRLEPVVELGDLEQLEAEGGAAEVAGEQGYRGGQATTRARPHDGHPVTIDAERPGLVVQPGERGVAVVQGRGYGCSGARR